MQVLYHDSRGIGNLKRLLVITDSSEAATGFGTAARNILPRLARAGFVIDALALYRQGGAPLEVDYGTAFPVEASDSMGFGQIPSMLARDPSVALLMHELVHCQEWALRMRTAGWVDPIIGYFPVYGPVLSPLEYRGLRLLDIRASLTHYGANVVQQAGFPCTGIHLGVDRERFRPARPSTRESLRRRLGWSGRFVVAYVARNRWNKQQPKLIRAAQILLRDNASGVLFYLHCVPTPGGPHWVPGMGSVLQEYDLIGCRRECGVDDMVQFPEDLVNQEVGIGGDELIRRLQAADCVVHAAHAEGFGLPLVEAMACGLPVACTADGAAMEEIVGPKGWYVHPGDSLVDATGNRYGDVAPEQWATTIQSMRSMAALRTPWLRARRQARSRSLSFSWDDTASRLASLVRRALSPGCPGWRTG